MGKSSIEWTDETWNPVVGCTEVSPGCKHCYAKTMAARQVLMSAAQGRRSVYLRVVDAQARRWTRPADVLRNPDEHQHVELLPERLGEPLAFSAGTRVFVVSMGDLFHADVPFDFILRVWASMAARPDCTFQVLTKRPARMVEFLAWLVLQTGPRVVDLGGVVASGPAAWASPLPNVGGESGPGARPMLRVARGWAQTRLADELNAGATYVTAMEVGRRSITLRTVDQLAVVLGMTPAQVLAELDAPIAAEVAA